MSGFADYQPGAGRRPVGASIIVRPAHVADLEACARLIVSRTGALSKNAHTA
ncbi:MULTISPECIES: hypothetical protein [unclassified Kribbella]|uniref:hypothetical protein n=1 Tax=unclassified Kribbella TaxID=2644121 RepID=UPI0033EF9198